MNAQTKITAAEPVDPLALLRAPFPPHQVSKLPKPTKAQTDAVKADFKQGIRCGVCGSWHHPQVVHLDYVGHAALTDRLLDVDPHWSWEPVAFRDGLPAFDPTGGLWIKLTVCGVTRLGYGHAAAKPGVDPGAREKEVIGDALRNAAMRFGAALDLWHKGDLHLDDEGDAPAKPGGTALATAAKAAIDVAETMAELDAWRTNNEAFMAQLGKDDPEAHDEIVRNWRLRAKLVKGRTPDAAKAEFPGSFDAITDDVAAGLNGPVQ